MSEVRFGGYRITETIGSGALSTIFKAVQEPLGRVVALKALKAQIAPTSSFGEQLDREAKILADLLHPNIVMLIDASRTPTGRPFVVLEHVEGPSLLELVAKSKKHRLSVPTALAIGCGVCAALEHVHARGVVHRDIKPSNVLLSRTGVVKVIDFGIAQKGRTGSVSDTLGTEGITASGRIAPEQVKDAFGTPAYMSPEQILGDFVDGRSDLFSLGVVLYEMIGGTRPFEKAAEDRKSTPPRLRRDVATPLRERAPHCPRGIERIVMRLLEKSPNERYPSASVLKERLEAALRAETRDAPAVLVEAALVETSFVPRSMPVGAPRSRGAAPPARPRVRTASASRILLGFTAITAAFVLGAAAIESTGTRPHEARGGGSGGLELVPEKAGGLRVVATPWAFVRVDGQLVETTPFARAIPLSAGRHWVTLSHPDAVAIERGVDIVTGETTMLDVTMNLSVEDAGKDAR